MDVLNNRFSEFGFPLIVNQNIIPNDTTTLFVCSGMQNLKERFSNPDNTHDGSIQSCIRTNDLDLVGDGSHLTLFKMIGNFSFGNNDYSLSCELWHNIIKDLDIKISFVTYHPSRNDHYKIWNKLGYNLKPDNDCVWSDGSIGGFCCEMFVGGLEIGNLVNTLEHSTDVGFGLERLIQVLEKKQRVDETSLFDQSIHPVLRDHVRSIRSMLEHNIKPGGKGREGILRTLLRRCIGYDFHSVNDLSTMIMYEKSLMEQSFKKAQKGFRKFKEKPDSWFISTYGISQEDINLLRSK